ncbi:hypothetical protein [Streptomyces sp. NPDC057854]|uniref:hypothetical protein n=1 Tax=unclassified Streptomyces TaxID=2593676 RepID=UPI00369EA779
MSDRPNSPGDQFTEAAIRRGTYLEAAAEADTASKLFPDTDEYAAAIGALEGLAQRLRRFAQHHTTAEQPAGLTWEARADHAVRLYARTAIELEDARAETTRLRARLAELEQPATAPQTTTTVGSTEPEDAWTLSAHHGVLPGRYRTERQQVAIELGRDLLRDGVVSFLRQLVGEPRTRALLAAHRSGALREAAHRAEQLGLRFSEQGDNDRSSGAYAVMTELQSMAKEDKR